MHGPRSSFITYFPKILRGFSSNSSLNNPREFCRKYCAHSFIFLSKFFAKKLAPAKRVSITKSFILLFFSVFSIFYKYKLPFFFICKAMLSTSGHDPSAFALYIFAIHGFTFSLPF